MHLSPEQLRSYHEDGYLLVEGVFDAAEVEVFRAQLPAIFDEDTPARVLEEGTETVRMTHGQHKTNAVFGDLVRDERVLLPARAILDDDVYVHQFKLNAKAAFDGETWAWHQDFVFWHHEDGMPEPRTLNAAVFLDDVHEFNGPLIVIPGTHLAGRHDEQARDTGLTEDDPDWMSHLTVELKYELERETIAAHIDRRGMVAPKAKAGGVLFFSPAIFHGSAPNMSTTDRTMALISYNSCENHLLEVPEPRPWFLAERDFTPVTPLGR
ncbi:MAG: phytanoyl-CoA dioxygenase family protein [Actinomycetota bacterium]